MLESSFVKILINNKLVLHFTYFMLNRQSVSSVIENMADLWMAIQLWRKIMLLECYSQFILITESSPSFTHCLRAHFITKMAEDTIHSIY